MIKQGRRGEWKLGNTGGESGREGAGGKGGRRELEKGGKGENWWEITRQCLSFCYQKDAKKKRQTILLRSLELSIFKNSD